MEIDGAFLTRDLKVSQAIFPNFWESPWGEQVLRQDREEFPYPWPESYWKQLQNDGHGGPHLFYDAGLTEGEVRAWALFEFPTDEWGHLQKIFVSPTVQGRGFGTRFLRSCLGLCETQEKIDLEVAADNRAAVSLYFHLGFSLVREEKSFYSDGRDAYKMSLMLNDFS